jgi:hypothetical protein
MYSRGDLRRALIMMVSIVLASAVMAEECDDEDPNCSIPWDVDDPDGSSSKPHNVDLAATGNKRKVAGAIARLQKSDGSGGWQDVGQDKPL